MEALHIRPLAAEGVRVGEEEERGKRREQEAEATEASSPAGSTTDEETDEDSELQPPPVVRRKVSFADAFGLDLVSVKEFDNCEAKGSEVERAPEREGICISDEFYVSCLFTVPSSAEELDQRLQVQSVELESLELLPGTSTLRGTVRVANLCYSKCVYARISLDRWSSYYDLLAEYVPGSSDRKTDRFTFKYTLIPPFGREGTRVDFCLRYETSVGIFWANNQDMNYVLFCHQKAQVKEHGPQVPEESSGHRGKRSCLKANRRGSTGEKPKTTNTATAAAEAHTAVDGDRKTEEIQSLFCHEGHKPPVDSATCRQRATRLAHDLSRRRHEPGAYSHDSPGGQEASRLTPAPWCEAARALCSRQKKPRDSRRVLTYHQIPLLTLDWKNDKPRQWGAADVEDIWTGRNKPTRPRASEENAEDRPAVNDLWETFPNGTGDAGDKDTSVCDVWQKFLNEPKDHAGVPESEWLQAAASVSPSNHREPRARDTQVAVDAPAGHHLLSHQCEASPPHAARRAEDRLPAEARVSGPGGDSASTHHASQRSRTSSVTDTRQEFSLQGARPVSGGCVDSPAECHAHAVWERGGIIGEAGGKGGDEPVSLRTGDLVTSSGESETTDTTGATVESQNASTVDMISQGARRDKGLSSRDAPGSAHTATDDTLAFRETIRQGTKRAEEHIMTNWMESRVSTEEEILRPHETESCAISQGYADGERCEEFGPNRKSENPLPESGRDENEIGPTRAHGAAPNQRRQENIGPSPAVGSDFKWDASENNDVGSSHKGASEMPPFDAEARQRRENALRANSSVRRRKENTLLISQAQNEPSRAIPTGEEQHVQKEEEEEHDSTLAQIEGSVAKSETGGWVSNRTEDGAASGCPEVVVEQREEKPVEVKGKTAASQAAAALGATDSEEKMYAERFGEDLVRGVWAEVFGPRDAPVADGERGRLGDKRDIARDRHPRSDAVPVPGALCPEDPNRRLSPGPGQTPVSAGAERRLLTTTLQTRLLSELQTELKSRALLGQDAAVASAAPSSRPPLTESCQTAGSPKDRGAECRTPRRSVGGQEGDAQKARSFHRRPGSSSEKSQEPPDLVRWSVYMLGHISRLLIWALLVAGFFAVLFLCDFPAFFAAYAFSLCWWFYKWRGHQVEADKGAGPGLAEKRGGV